MNPVWSGRLGPGMAIGTQGSLGLEDGRLLENDHFDPGVDP